jgi:adenine/guanine phosphoribosyltransferase-like PRPP-binding protein
LEARSPATVDRPDPIAPQLVLPLMPEDRDKLLEGCRAYLDHYCMFRSPPGPPLLTSYAGGRARWQLYMPVAVLDQQFMARIAMLFWDHYLPLFKERPFQLCGVVSGGVPLACALQAYALRAGFAVNTFEIKKAAKTYGLLNWLEGIVDPALPVLLVDDVVGAGLSLRTAAKRLHSFGLELFGAWAIVAGNPAFPPPRKIKLDDTREANVETLFEPHHLAWSHEQYVMKYRRPPQFHGVMR